MKIKFIFATLIILVGLMIISCQEMIDIEDEEDIKTFSQATAKITNTEAIKQVQEQKQILQT